MSAASWVVMIAGWAAVAGLAIWTVCRLFPAQRDRDAHAILDARLASGEIDMDSYQRMRDLLGNHSQIRTEGLR
ncbi:SHOCT domain-containing protein [Cellulomonas sp. PSBB021]|uniref:SHOCT domain-containing protein n=1 Tax=Cellulomonas sp. PSBB021 TaxID=2003551 RepID=UPI001E5F30D2|nr:SHOCT domain-containing protein [Cellulomonas sp. PSBB021]